ncbi:response regulator transcription factor [Parahaliea mediterranea]|uniref:Response regulator transcription factor n=1 Tax=Parahaliea mediterranea TaxID=651086 RepID=A0A939ILW8_9GAMM|nr:response regulator transcription factor [Parahaliea mediterranea]MBN7796397.1 response regulator transcription factor [Parahaliea mediterranea]
MKLLLVEDDATTRDYLAKGLREQGYALDEADNGVDALHQATTAHYDLVVLDRMLPQLDGLSVLSALRAAGDTTPVIILSALSHVDERIKGLRAGGDDYLAKPFSFAELQLRIDNLLQRSGNTGQRVTELAADDLVMDLVGRRVTRGGVEIRLQPKEFQLLRHLLEHRGQVVSRTLLFEAVWDYHFDPKTNVIDVHVAKLRRKLEEGGRTPLIQTVRGAGYVVR